ncbi:MAG: CDP-alcohol phosphatidyltransferase family protein [Candidatus Nanopelagicaceae bacterium]
MSGALDSLTVTAETSLLEILELFKGSTKDLLLIDERTIITDPHLELLTDYPRSTSAALVAIVKNGNTLVRQNRVASASSKSHKVTIGNRDFVGALRLCQKQRELIIPALENAIAFKAKGNALDLLLVALVRATIKVDAVDVLSAPWSRSDDSLERERVRSEIKGLNIAALRLKMANRANDGFFSVFFLRKFSKILTWVAVKVGATPNQVTLLSFAIGLYSAYSFSRGTFLSTLLGAILLQVSIIVDCVDGELARYTRKFSKLGAWLDAVTDRVKEYLVFLGLAYGASLEGRNLWIPAMAMMVIQTFRHLSDYNFAQSVKIRAEDKFTTPVDFMAEFDGIVPTEREPKGRLRYWLGKIIQFPIGERWLVISASAVIGGAAFTFTIMPILAFISAFVVFRGRTIRTKEMEKKHLKSSLIVNQSDLLGVKASFTKRVSWIEPSILRLIESLVLIAIFINQDVLGIPSFIILFSIIFHHYDNLYRALQNERKPLWLSALGLYLGGRILLIGLALLAGVDITLIAWYFAAIFLVLSSIQWVMGHKQNRIAG